MDYVVRYMPEITASNKQLIDLSTTIGEEINSLYKRLFQIIYSVFLFLEDENGKPLMDLKSIGEWEKVFGYNASNLKIEDRLTELQYRRLFRSPFTVKSLSNYLNKIWKNGNFYLDVDVSEKTVFIDVNTYDTEIYLNYQNMIRRIIPANMLLTFAIPYLYLYLERYYKYGITDNVDYTNLLPLSELTYGELSQFSTY